MSHAAMHLYADDASESASRCGTPLPENPSTGSMIIVPSSTSIQDMHQAAIMRFFLEGNFADIQFNVFSRRTSRIVTDRRPLFANSLSLKAVSGYFERLLCGGFAESVSGVLSSAEHINLGQYGYESDSDLEDGDDDPSDIEETKSPVPSRAKTVGIPRSDGVAHEARALEVEEDVNTPQEPEERGKGFVRQTSAKFFSSKSAPSEGAKQPQSPSQATASRIPTVKGTREPPASRTDTTAASGVPMDATAPSRVPTGKVAKVTFQVPQSQRACRAVPVNDMAFKTWQAFMFYATFGKVEFAPLLSQGPTTRKEQVTWQTELPRPPRCSPKSMYRLADKYDILELKRLAKAGIEERLSEYNILQELFSPFTSWYPEILELEIRFLRNNPVIKAKVAPFLPRLLQRVAAGDLPHSGDALIALFESSPVATELKCSRCFNSGYSRNCSNCGGRF